MVTSSEKRELIESIVDSIVHRKNVGELHKRIHELLLRDTVDGKLYKYRYFDRKGYSVKSIKDGTLYCANPDSFNDPFDCKIGITFSDYFEKAHPKESDLIRSIFKKLTLLMDEKLDINDCNDEEKSIIEKILQNNLLYQTPTSQINKYNNISINRTQTLFSETLKTVLSDDTIKHSIGPYIDEICEVVSTIAFNNEVALSDNSSIGNIIARASDIEPDADEIDIMINAGEKLLPKYIHHFKTARENIDELNTQITDNMRKIFRACCLCTSFKNKLMWSHYSSSHTGFCIEYDFSGNDKAALNNLPFPIYYSNKRPTVPWENTINCSTQDSENAALKLMVGMLTKGDTWEYENEWRILIGGQEKTKIQMPKITCIYLGAYISPKNRNKILKIAKKKQISVKQMKIDRGTYELHAEDLLIY